MPRQEFSRSLTTRADVERVWRSITDVERVASWLTVVSNVTIVEPFVSYSAVLEEKMGPFSLRADLVIRVTDMVDGQSIHFQAEGEDRQIASRITVDAGIEMRAVGSGTEIAVEGVYEVSGRVATMGASIIRNKAAQLIEEFFAAATREFG